MLTEITDFAKAMNKHLQHSDSLKDWDLRLTIELCDKFTEAFRMYLAAQDVEIKRKDILHMACILMALWVKLK